MGETRLSLNARVIVGGLLVLESLLVLIVAVFTAIIGGLVGPLAFLAGGGGATDDKIAQGFAVIALTIASPFVAAGVLSVGGVFLLLGRRKRVVITAGIFAMTAQVALHLSLAEGFHAAELVPGAVHLLAIAVGFTFVPARGASAAPT